MRLDLFIALAVLAAPSIAVAGSGCESSGEAAGVVHHIFEKADQDRDGSLTRAEYEAAGLDGYGVAFDESDANADGQTSLDEYLELYQRHHPPVDRTEA